MAQLARPLRLWPRWQQQCYSLSTPIHPFFSSFFASVSTSSQRHLFAVIPFPHRNVYFRSHGLRLPESSVPSDFQETDRDSEYQLKKSRNDKKREARRAVRWGMELATFSDPQIKRILKVASLEREVFDALMLVKRLGPDVREGKRRQFNYIGRLLRKVQPEMMDAIIQASKDGDQSKLQELSGSSMWIHGEDDEVEEYTEYEEEEEEGSHVDIANRWFDGLIDKDADITNEVYSIHSVEFDRQELRKLVRRVHSIQEHQLTKDDEGKDEVAMKSAKKSLIHFLHALAKQMPTF